MCNIMKKFYRFQKIAKKFYCFVKVELDWVNYAFRNVRPNLKEKDYPVSLIFFSRFRSLMIVIIAIIALGFITCCRY